MLIVPIGPADYFCAARSFGFPKRVDRTTMTELGGWIGELRVTINEGEVGANSKTKIEGMEGIGCGCATLPFLLAAVGVVYWLGYPIWLVPAGSLMLIPLALTGRIPSDLMKKKDATLFAFFVCASITGFVFAVTGGLSDREDKAPVEAVAVAPVAPVAPTLPPPAPRKPDVKVSLKEIFGQFENNQVKAARYFDENVALIPIRVVRVREALGTGIIVTDTRIDDRQIELFFDEAGTRRLENLDPGSRVVATCPSISEAMGQVIIACTDVMLED